ncbi:MAG: hypothetical protein K0R71_1210 [Bacillales bacterium]|jgi:hypothetical protein|nr:hypothetical protein [Bacillales bacterium]
MTGREIANCITNGDMNGLDLASCILMMLGLK